MVKVQEACVILLLVFTGSRGDDIIGTGNISSVGSSPAAQVGNITSDEKTMKSHQIFIDVHSFSSGNTTITRKVKQIKAEIRAYYRNLYGKMDNRKNNSDSVVQTSATGLNEFGKPIHKSVCQVISDWNKCANSGRNPLLNYENWQCPVLSSGIGGDSLMPSITIVSDYELGEEILLTDTGIKNHSEPGNCTVVIFYARWCNMSARVAQHFNAIPRAFKNIRFVAVDTYKHSEVISTFVIYSVPTVLLFHNGRIQARYMNENFDIMAMSEFLEKYTDQESSFVTIQPSDYEGPIPTVAVPIFAGEELIFAWIFILISCVYGLFTQPVFNLFLKLYLNLQAIMEDVEFPDSKFMER